MQFQKYARKFAFPEKHPVVHKNMAYGIFLNNFAVTYKILSNICLLAQHTNTQAQLWAQQLSRYISSMEICFSSTNNLLILSSLLCYHPLGLLHGGVQGSLLLTLPVPVDAVLLGPNLCLIPHTLNSTAPVSHSLKVTIEQTSLER